MEKVILRASEHKDASKFENEIAVCKKTLKNWVFN